MIGANMSGIKRSDGCFVLSGGDAAPCVSSSDVKDTDDGNNNGLAGECQNVVGVSLEEVSDYQFVVCFKDNRGEIGASNSPDGCLGLSDDGNNIFVSSAKATEITGGDKDGSRCECEIMDSSVLEKLVDNEHQVCLNESHSEVDVCCAGINGLSLDKRGFLGKLPLGEMPRNSSLSNCDQQDRHMDDQEVNLPSVEVEIDVLAEVKVGNGNQTFSSGACGMPLESIPESCLPRNCVQLHGQKDDNIASPLSRKEVVMIEKTDVLTKLNKAHDQILPSPSFKIPSELKLVTVLPRNCVQQDDLKDYTSNGCHFSEVFVNGMEERTNAFDVVDEVTCGQILTSQCCEMPSELLSLTGSPGNSVGQEDQKNNYSVDYPSSKEYVENVEEKLDALARIEKVTCDKMMHSQCCEMPSELISLSGSPQNCVQQGDQKNDKNFSSPSSEGVEIMEQNLDTHDQTLLLQDCAMSTELISGPCSLRNHAQQNEQNGDEGISELVSSGLSLSSARQNKQKGIEITSYLAPEVKANTSVGVEVNTCNCVSTSKVDEMPFKFSCEVESMRNEGCNDRIDHKSLSHLIVETTVEAIETKGHTDTYISALPVQSCWTALESIHKADSLSNFSQTNEQGNDMTVDSLSAESATVAVELKSDVTTDVKVEICGQVSPMEESLKEQSCQPLAVGENGSCKNLDVADLAQKDDVLAISSSGAVDGFGRTDYEGEDNVGVSCISETNYSNIASSSSGRSGQISRSRRKTQTKRAARKCRTTAKAQHSHGSININFKIARRKRSCFSKPARSSIWGLLGNITQIFSDSDVSGFSLAQNQGSQKARSGKGSQKRSKIRAGGTTSRSGRNCDAPTRGLRLKVKFGNKICQSSLNVVVPECVDTTGSDDAIVGDDITESLRTNTSEVPKLADDVEDKLEGEDTERQFQCFDTNLEEILTHRDDSILDVHIKNKDLEDTVIDKSVGDVADDSIGIIANEAVEMLVVTENNNVDPGTSPDSEVINLAPDAELGARSQGDLEKIVSTSSEAFTAPGYVTGSKRGKKKTNLPLAGNIVLEESSPVAATANKATPPKKCGGGQKIYDIIQSGESLFAYPDTNASSNSSKGEEFCGKPLLSSRKAEPGIIGEATVPSIKSKVKSDGTKKGNSKGSNSARSRRKNTSLQGEKQRKAVNKKKAKEKGVSAAKRRGKGSCEQVEDKTEDQPQIGSHIADDNGETDSGNNSASVDEANTEIISGGELDHYAPPESAWVRCDDCHKWRRISFSLLKSIECCRWICKDNMDKAFTDCSIPQEKSNADINAELGLSDFEEDDGLANNDRFGNELESSSITSQPGSWFRRIDSNVFLHRSRKTQTIDEVMVCHCKPPSDGGFGCGDECLNRMLNIECVQGTCPCGDFCSNQQFQKRKYANMQWRRYGKKGFGLALLEDISKGKFIIEYVGEVLDMQAYEARQKEYAANGHKHFYFMTLNGSEVIDACAKGNLGRFINHSCDPNCRTEKWMVNGEICIGLFAMRDIKQGEELTFDYNYVRVFGAAAKKCHCGSPQCRGYIGGDPQNTEIIYHGDSDEEYPEPVMLEDGETEDHVNKVSRKQIVEALVKDRNKVDDSIRAVRKLELNEEVDNLRKQTASAISVLQNLSEMGDSKGKYPSRQSSEPSLLADVTSIPVSAAKQDISEEEEIMKKASSLIPQVEIFKSDTVEENQGVSKSRPRIKTSRKPGSVKKGKADSSSLNGNKVKMIVGN